MTTTPRWHDCVVHIDDSDISNFLERHLSHRKGHTVFVGSCGFDVRAATLARRLVEYMGPTGMEVMFIREVRESGNSALASRGAATQQELLALYPKARTQSVRIFGPDRAVITGHSVAKILPSLPIDGVTDFVLDFTALSVGVSFPLVKFLLEHADSAQHEVNVHVFLTQETTQLPTVAPVPADTALAIRGFTGGWRQDAMNDKAKLWMPQLRTNRLQELKRIYDEILPHDVVPVLPFPAREARLGDEIVEFYRRELEESWEVDARNIVYAAEDDPVDLYRTVLQIDSARQRVFAATGGSTLLLSPTGSKAHALGTLMAAYEREFPVLYVECAGYESLDSATSLEEAVPAKLRHLWLAGEVYKT